MNKIVLFITFVAVVYGNAIPSPRIVGGYFAEESQFPYQVALIKGDAFSCGGSIISKKFVLTAAHCVFDQNGNLLKPEDLNVLAGSILLSNRAKLHKVNQIIPHEDYGNFVNDVALLRIEDEFVFSNTTQKIELRKEEIPVNVEVYLSGWGRTSTNGAASNQLKYLKSITIANKKCSKYTGFDHNGLVCFESGDKNGVCFGDSGGPAAYENTLVGVANFILTECGSPLPDGYARVSFYYDWIVKNAEL